MSTPPPAEDNSTQPATEGVVITPARPQDFPPPGSEILRFTPRQTSGTPLTEVTLSSFKDESQLDDIMALIFKDLSEPYSIFTYRRFVHGWPEFTLLAHDASGKLVGVIICRSESRHRVQRMRGYVAMLAVDKEYRRCGLGRRLVVEVLHRMALTCDELSLETEVTNTPALKLYESLGFIRDKRLCKYYLNGNDAWRLKVWLN